MTFDCFKKISAFSGALNLSSPLHIHTCFSRRHRNIPPLPARLICSPSYIPAVPTVFSHLFHRLIKQLTTTENDQALKQWIIYRKSSTLDPPSFDIQTVLLSFAFAFAFHPASVPTKRKMSPFMNTPPATPASTGNASTSQPSNSLTVGEFTAITTAASSGTQNHRTPTSLEQVAMGEAATHRRQTACSSDGMDRSRPPHTGRHAFPGPGRCHRSPWPLAESVPVRCSNSREINVSRAWVARMDQIREMGTARQGHRAADAARGEAQARALQEAHNIFDGEDSYIDAAER